MTAPADPRPEASAAPRSPPLGPRVAVCLALSAVAVWLWVCWCVFSGTIWNDVRLAPAFALARGLPMYATATRGIVSTWMYGPLPAVLMWPATLARSAAHAVLIAGALNILITTAAIAAVCAAWPAPAGRGVTPTGRLLAAALVIALWSELGFQYLQADNFAIAFGLVGNLFLMDARGPAGRWGAAACAMAALACKQTSLGVAAAQILWLGLTCGRREALRHAGRCLVAGLAFFAWMLATFGWEGIWFTLLLVPSKIPWINVPGRRLYDLAHVLVIHLAAPALLMLVFRRAVWRRDSVLLLPSLTWLLAIPGGMAALMKLGGSINSLQSFLLWLPPAMVAAVAAWPAHRPRLGLPAGLSLLTLGLIGLRLALMPSIPWRPLLEHYRQADYLARNFRGEIWFPWNPLVTIYSDDRYYHDEDGLFVRFITGHPVTLAQARAGLPPRLCVIALRQGDVSWGIVRSLMPPEAKRTDFGVWTLYSWPPPAAAQGP